MNIHKYDDEYMYGEMKICLKLRLFKMKTVEEYTPIRTYMGRQQKKLLYQSNLN